MSDIVLQTDPFPHFVCDMPIEESFILQMRQHWPGAGYFEPEIPGNYVCDMKRFSDKAYWKIITQTLTVQIFQASSDIFGKWIRARHGEAETEVDVYSLMQADGDYGGHDVHTHHYHSPHWIITTLLYLDADAQGHAGTTLYRVKDGVDPAYAAAQTMNWQGVTEEYSTVEYKQGRILCFLDGPTAFHGVKPSTGRFGRRILRMHIAAKTPFEALYGVSLEEYRALRRGPTTDDRVLEWMRRDIEQIKNAA